MTLHFMYLALLLTTTYLLVFTFLTLLYLHLQISQKNFFLLIFLVSIFREILSYTKDASFVGYFLIQFFMTISRPFPNQSPFWKCMIKSFVCLKSLVFLQRSFCPKTFDAFCFLSLSQLLFSSFSFPPILSGLQVFPVLNH